MQSFVENNAYLFTIGAIAIAVVALIVATANLFMTHFLPRLKEFGYRFSLARQLESTFS